MPVLRIPGRRGSRPLQNGGSWPDGGTTRRQGSPALTPDPGQWRGPRYEMLPPPHWDGVRATVERLANSLKDAIDEGTGASLDRLIESWTQRWVTTVESEYAGHCAEIKARRELARQQLAEASGMAELEREQLDHLRSDLAASRRRLSGESPDPAASGAVMATPALTTGNAGQPGVLAMATAAAGSPTTFIAPPRPSSRADWSEPHLVAGRGWISMAIGGILIVIGAMADTIAFRNVLELVLPNATGTEAWLMAGGSTSLALVVAAILGISRAVRHRGRYVPLRRRPSRLPVFASSTVWLGMGLAMFLIRWQDSGTGNSFSVNNGVGPGQSSSTIWQAVFFLAIYLISGVCTIFEAERLYNPERSAFAQLRKDFAAQAKVATRAEAEKERAQAALDRCDDELQTQVLLRDHAISDRKGLGAEAANYARVVMAALMNDPAKTGITETGPAREPYFLLGTGPAPAGSTGPAPAAPAGTGTGQPPGAATGTP